MSPNDVSPSTEVTPLGVAVVPEDTSGSLWMRLGVAGGAIALLYAPIFPRLAEEWATFPSLSHGFAIPFIAAYIIWVTRDQVAAAPNAPTWAGLPVLLMGLLVYVLGTLGGETFLARISLPVTLIGASILVLGPRRTWSLAPGIVYLFFMIPLPWVTLKGLTDKMRVVDATMAGNVLPWVGVPVYQEGVLLRLSNMTLEVADVCSSIPAMSALLATGAAYGFVTRRPPAIRAMLIFLAPPLGILSNIVRIVITAIGAYHLGPIALDNIIHTSAGTTVFLMTLGALLGVDTLVSRIWRLR